MAARKSIFPNAQASPIKHLPTSPVFRLRRVGGPRLNSKTVCGACWRYRQLERCADLDARHDCRGDLRLVQVSVEIMEMWRQSTPMRLSLAWPRPTGPVENASVINPSIPRCRNTALNSALCETSILTPSTTTSMILNLWSMRRTRQSTLSDRSCCCQSAYARTSLAPALNVRITFAFAGITIKRSNMFEIHSSNSFWYMRFCSVLICASTYLSQIDRSFSWRNRPAGLPGISARVPMVPC